MNVFQNSMCFFCHPSSSNILNILIYMTRLLTDVLKQFFYIFNTYRHFLWCMMYSALLTYGAIKTNAFLLAEISSPRQLFFVGRVWYKYILSIVYNTGNYQSYDYIRFLRFSYNFFNCQLTSKPKFLPFLLTHTHS